MHTKIRGLVPEPDPQRAFDGDRRGEPYARMIAAYDGRDARRRQTELIVRYCVSEGYAVAEVSDDGPGIDVKPDEERGVAAAAVSAEDAEVS